MLTQNERRITSAVHSSHFQFPELDSCTIENIMRASANVSRPQNEYFLKASEVKL